ncbi:MAG TPA: hypothetical protein VGW78_04880 [Candidatus Babeliales bacterium]|jgi:hypothetical protein|nr:hypothetical protein [Candidatus Babeliales bacterium]
MKKQLHIAVLVGAVSSGILNATTSEFRSPLRIIRGVMHSYLSPIEDAWWFEHMPECDRNPCWHVDAWGASYYRAADKAFFNPCGGSTTKTTSLSTLFFGAESFTGQQFFVNGTVSPAQLNSATPFLAFARISPRFTYTERGVVAGLHARYTFGNDDCWHAGFRVGLPVKDIEVEPVNVGAMEETLQDVFDVRDLCVGTGATDIQTVYAFRLDFLTALNQCRIDSSGNEVTTSVVQYDNGTGSPTNANNATQIAGVVASGSTASGPVAGEVTLPPVYLTRVGSGGSGTGNCLFTNAPTGQFPAFPYCKPSTDVSGPLAADGSGGAVGQSLFFQFGQDYAAGLGTDTNAQASLFVVPRCDPDRITGLPVVNTQANTIRENVQAIVTSGADTFETSIAFFQSQGIDFTRFERIVGVGDLDTEVYVGYGHHDEAFLDGIVGVRFPTGTKPKTATRIYYQPTGNKKHFEIKLGLEGGWQPHECFAFRLDAAYHHAFKADECRAAPFKQKTSPCNIDTDCCENSCSSTCDTSCSSTCDEDCCEIEENKFPNVDCSTIFVKNVGPNLCVDVSWDYFVGHAEFTVFHPCNPELGMAFGYEIMYKGKDHVSGDNCDCTTTGILTATDLLGNTNQPLDLSILEDRTRTITHKVYGEIFHRWNYFELFGGASHIVAGENAMKESEIHLGMKIFF